MNRISLCPCKHKRGAAHYIHKKRTIHIATDIPEDQIEIVMSHEYLHWILAKRIGGKASRGIDSLRRLHVEREIVCEPYANTGLGFDPSNPYGRGWQLVDPQPKAEA
jgi:hypothetical protein